MTRALSVSLWLAVISSARADGEPLQRFGEFQQVIGRPGIIVTAPHGTADVGIDRVFWRVVARSHAGGVIATGFVEGPTRVNVNRPTEQTATGRAGEQPPEQETARAADATRDFLSRIQRVGAGPIHFYFELHDNNWPQSQSSIEIATGGVTRDEAARFKTLFQQAYVEFRSTNHTFVRPLQVNIEPLSHSIVRYRETTRAAPLVEKGFVIEIPWHADLDAFGEILGTTIERFTAGADDWVPL